MTYNLFKHTYMESLISHEMLPCKVLQVDPDATEDEVKKQYRRLSILLHPDKNHNNRDRATSAFEVRN